MKKFFSLPVIVLFAISIANAQNVSINNDGSAPNPSAILDVKSTSKGLLIPRVALIDALDVATIPNPAASLLIYNTATGGVGRFAVSPGFYFWNSISLQWVALTVSDNSVKGAWLLGGNIGTSTINNFIGTTDNQALLFKLNNQNAGYLGLAGNTFWGLNSGDINNGGYSNVAIGNYALNKNTNRSNLVAVGDSALLNNGTGATTAVQSINNTALGSKALYTNNLGSYNTAIGYNALLANTNGTQNTATGVDALHFNSTGILNSAHGINALFLNTTGSFNSAQGSNSLVNNSKGSNNTASGFGALFSNTTGFSNVGVGINALRLNTDRSNIVSIGDSSLFNNGVGATLSYHGTLNTAVGSKTLYTNTTGYANSSVGYQALQNNTSGALNCALGLGALLNNTTGNSNNAIGANAMFFSFLGNGNNALGTDALAHNGVGNRNIAIGDKAMYVADFANNIIAIGDSALYHNALSHTQPWHGGYNTAIGSKAMYENLTGFDNTAVGFQTLFNNTVGNSNQAIGKYALVNNTSGSYNIAMGTSSLLNNTTGSSNIAIGTASLDSATNAGNTIAIGDSAMYHYKGGDIGNTAVGSQALYSLTGSSANTAIGRRTLYKNRGTANTALGDNTLGANTFGNYNTGLGAFSLYNSYGDNNSAVGESAMNDNTSGADNTVFGVEAMYNNTIGNKNVAIGNSSLADNITGSKNTVIGYQADVSTNNQLNSTAIGANAQSNCSSCMVLGSVNGINSATSDVKVGIGVNTPQTALHVSPNAAGGILIGGNKNAGGFTNLELGISANTGGYSYIQSTQSSGSSYGNISLNPSGGSVGIHMNVPLSPLHIKQTNDIYPVVGGGLRLERNSNTNHWEIGTDTGDDLDFSYNNGVKAYLDNVNGMLVSPSDIRLKKDINLIGTVLPAIIQLQPKTYHYKTNATDAPLSYGFIAQEVEKLFPDFVTTKGPDSLKAITYQEFTIVAIKAIQEQQVIIEAQNKRIEKLEQQMELLLKK